MSNILKKLFVYNVFFRISLVQNDVTAIFTMLLVYLFNNQLATYHDTY